MSRQTQEYHTALTVLPRLSHGNVGPFLIA
jgi:hypothetical protein